MKSKIWKIPYSKPVIPPELLAAGYTPLLAAVLNLRIEILGQIFYAVFMVLINPTPDPQSR